MSIPNGLIGSARPLAEVYDLVLLDLDGVVYIGQAAVPGAAEALDRVYAPVGLDIGSQTVAEIAVSIAAELVAHRNLGIAGHHSRQRTTLAAGNS